MIKQLSRINFSEQELREISRKLERASSLAKADRLAAAATLATLVFLLLGAACFFYLPLIGLFLLLVALLSKTALGFYLDYLIALRVKNVELELPFATRYFAQLLCLGIGPEEALNKISAMNFGELSILLRDVLKHFHKGSSLEKAFAFSQQALRSQRYDQFVSIVLQTSKVGVTSESVELAMRLARHFIEEKKHQYEEFSSRASLLTMLMVTLTTLLPAVLAFVIAFTKTFSDPVYIYFLFLVVMPALSIFMFARMKLAQPD